MDDGLDDAGFVRTAKEFVKEFQTLIYCTYTGYVS